MKYLVLCLLSLSFFSCARGEKTEYENQDILEYMEKYIYETNEGAYGYFECVTEKEQIDSLSWESDLYLIQKDLYLYANQRRIVVVNNYISPNSPSFDFVPKSLFDFYKKPFFTAYIDEIPNTFSQELKKSYLTNEEREICDYVYYKETCPLIISKIEKLQSNGFKGFRYHHICGFRLLTGEIRYKNFVVYKRGDSQDYNVCELKYDYKMLREFIESVLNMNLESEKVKSLINKYSSFIKESPENLYYVNEVYSSVIQRFKMNH